MKLKVYLPSDIFLETEVTKVVAESPEGGFCLKPRHIDYVTALAPGILSYSEGGRERFIAVDGGILAKQQEEISVATRHAVSGELGELRKEVERMLTKVDEHEKMSRSAVARLEVGFLRRLVEFGHG